MMITIIQQKLQTLNPIKLEIINESELHRGHSGYKTGDTHFKIIIISNAFEGLSRIARHKLVYNLLKHELDNQIHALSINAYTNEEYRN